MTAVDFRNGRGITTSSLGIVSFSDPALGKECSDFVRNAARRTLRMAPNAEVKIETLGFAKM